MQERAQYRIGIYGGAADLRKSCRSALRDVAVVREVDLDPDTGELIGDFAIELLLFRLAPPLEPMVRRLALFRKNSPTTQVIVLGSEIPIDLAVELVKCGVDDYLSVPIEHWGLHRKILRALGEHRGPAFGWALLSHFNFLSSEPYSENRRHCFRASIDITNPVSVAVVDDDIGRPSQLEAINLSIATDGWPGGMLLRAHGPVASQLPFGVWEMGAEIELNVDLRDGGRPIVVVGQMVPGTRPGPEGRIDFAVQYWTRLPADEGRIRRYWAEAQRPCPEDRPSSRSRRTTKVIPRKP